MRTLSPRHALPPRLPLGAWLGWAIPLLLLILTACEASPTPAPEGLTGADAPPRVLLIVVDTLRADRLSQYGYALPTSPALARLFAESAVFTRAYAPSPWTTPSTSSIHSGLSPFRHGAVRMGATLQPEIRTLAEALDERGLKGVGFSYNVHIARKTGFDQGFRTFLDYEGRTLAYPDVEQMTRYADLWLERNLTDPFFLYLHPMNCHGPYRVPRERLSDLLGHPPIRGFSYYGRLMKDIMTRQRVQRRKDVTPAILRSLNERYDAAVRYSTDELGAFIERLRRLGIYDDMTVVLTADHGEELFDHGGFSHGFTLYDEVTRVPLVIKMPRQRGGMTIDTPVTLMDIYPTVVELAGASLGPTALDGRSLVPLMRGDVEHWDARPLLLHLDWPRRTVARAVVEGPYKLIHVDKLYDGRTDVDELYDLVADPREQANLAEGDPALLASLRARLEALSKVAEERALPAPTNVRDDMDEEALKALGYLQ